LPVKLPRVKSNRGGNYFRPGKLKPSASRFKKAPWSLNPEGKFVYKYLIKNLPTSPTHVSSFTVQTFAKDIEIIEPEDVIVGDMINTLRDFKEGVWWRYAVLGEFLPKVEPGRSIEFTLISSAIPGIVGCRATAGDMTLKGVGEHMPQELERSMPGYEEWAKGYTIGPVDNLKTLDKNEKVKYLLDNLSKFQEAGWMNQETANNYKILLEENDLSGVFILAKKDLESEFITGEVFQIIENLDL
jgi:hypothetical protein